ncbi:hypothetical protein [Streptomyces sp. B3I8]|nr:hypothetical protein [Streptomyces sp. B3I8]MDQ0785759.1 hypothetical protein [Streptomyces sp. B3I8]
MRGPRGEGTSKDTAAMLLLLVCGGLRRSAAVCCGLLRSAALW